MSALRYGLTVAALAGISWGAVLMVVFGATLMLVSGVAAKPPVGAAALAGLVAALFAALRAPSGPDHVPGPMRWVGSAAVAAGALLIFTFAQPFGIAPAEATFWQVAMLVAFGALTGAGVTAVQGPLGLGRTSRYAFEAGIIRLLRAHGFVFFIVIVALPFYVMVMTSLKSQQALLGNPLDFSVDLTSFNVLRSYTELFVDYNFGRFILVSAVVSVATVIITLMVSIPGAYAVSRLRFRGQVQLSRSILLIYMVPAIVLVIPLYAVFSQLGLRNTLTGLMIVYPATTIPVALYMLQGYFRGLPSELDEAGLMDGLTRVGVIWKINLPLSLPALASVSLYVFMIAWNEFLFAFMFLDDPQIFTLSRGVVSLNSSEVPRQHLMAGAVITTVPILVIFLWFERYLVQGLTAGSVKG